MNGGNASRPGVPLSLDAARMMVEKFIVQYNNIRLHSAIVYVAPLDKLNGWELEIFKERDRKLEKARELRKKKTALGRIEKPDALQYGSFGVLTTNGSIVHFQLKRDKCFATR